MQHLGDPGRRLLPGVAFFLYYFRETTPDSDQGSRLRAGTSLLVRGLQLLGPLGIWGTENTCLGVSTLMTCLICPLW